MDSSKAVIPDIRHRAIFHSSFGCFIVEKVFGTNITNSAGKQISVRDVAEDHIMEDLGFIPTVEKYFATMQIEQWMGGKSKKIRKVMDFNEVDSSINDKVFDRQEWLEKLPKVDTNNYVD